jgi:hypothetical protein
MEKCPPAEACRDAFERMSRATVQMCLSTTGFGAQAEVAGSRLGASLRPWPSVSHSSKSQKANRRELRPSQTPITQSQHSQARHERGAPKFDMNLDGLFTDRTSANQNQATGGRRSNRGQRPPYQVQQAISLQPEQSREQYSSNAPYMQSYGGYDGSPPQQQQQQPFIYANSPQSVSSGGAPQGYTPPPNPEQETLAPISLDFLDLQNAETGPDGNPTFNPMSLPSFGQGTQGTGLNLGFGMEVDYQHDWSEGGGYDLFDGFFFGGSNTGV